MVLWVRLEALLEENLGVEGAFRAVESEALALSVLGAESSIVITGDAYSCGYWAGGSKSTVYAAVGVWGRCGRRLCLASYFDEHFGRQIGYQADERT